MCRRSPKRRCTLDLPLGSDTMPMMRYSMSASRMSSAFGGALAVSVGRHRLRLGSEV
jgi:hypothetical protein